MVHDKVSLRKLRDGAIAEGMGTLELDGLGKVKAGIVSIEEVLRKAQGLDLD